MPDKSRHQTFSTFQINPYYRSINFNLSKFETTENSRSVLQSYPAEKNKQAIAEQRSLPI